MKQFVPATYSPPIAELWVDGPFQTLPELGPGSPNEQARAALSALTIENAFPATLDQDAARACLSGLWLYHNFMDPSHTICQDLQEWYGSYWHGILHRREPDPANAKYWFRHVPSNPVFDLLPLELNETGLSLPLLVVETTWDPFKFVDACEAERGTGSTSEFRCRGIQLVEFQLLFDWCYRKATAG
ncbi:MAG: hypothetical protein EXS09_10085 [Gemmataceae bacterium]|nr:hypothetical protein [Gemmataceae bacterium]